MLTSFALKDKWRHQFMLDVTMIVFLLACHRCCGHNGSLVGCTFRSTQPFFPTDTEKGKMLRRKSAIYYENTRSLNFLWGCWPWGIPIIDHLFMRLVIGFALYEKTFPSTFIKSGSSYYFPFTTTITHCHTTDEPGTLLTSALPLLYSRLTVEDSQIVNA